MRHTSALKIIGLMRRRFGMPLSISAICRGVDLSYQPVHFHISRLKELGVVGVRKSGRTAICRFVASEAASIWLALLAGQEEAAANFPEGFTEYAGDAWPKYQCISARRTTEQVIAVPMDSDDDLGGECGEVFGGWELRVLSDDDFFAFLRTDDGTEWVRAASVLCGHQRFWRHALSAGLEDDLVFPADAAFLSKHG